MVKNNRSHENQDFFPLLNEESLSTQNNVHHIKVFGIYCRNE